MQESPKFNIVVVTTKREKSPEEVAQEKLLFLGMESGLLLVGKSRSHTQMLHDYCFQEGRGHVALDRFVEGSCENGVIKFENETPIWKQGAVMDFLAGQALVMAIENDDRLNKKVAALTNMVMEARH